MKKNHIIPLKITNYFFYSCFFLNQKKITRNISFFKEKMDITTEVPSPVVEMSQTANDNVNVNLEDSNTELQQQSENLDIVTEPSVVVQEEKQRILAPARKLTIQEKIAAKKLREKSNATKKPIAENRIPEKVVDSMVETIVKIPVKKLTIQEKIAAKKLREQSTDGLSGTELQKAPKIRKHKHALFPKKIHKEGSTRPHKFKPGSRALLQIRRLQRYCGTLIPRTVVKAILAEILSKEGSNVRVQRKYVDVLHELIESHGLQRFQDALMFSIYRGRKSVREKDFNMAQHYCDIANLSTAIRS